jgi:hypothetical protein
MNKNLLENFVSDPKKILRKARSKLRSPDSRPTTSALEDSTARSLTPTFEVMENKSLREYFAPTPNNIHIGPTVAVGNAAFELKPALINMVQASQFCGKAREDANKHLQNFLEICSTFTIKDVLSDQSYFVYSHSHYWGERSNGFTPTKTNSQLRHCVLLPFWQSYFL